MKKILHLLMFRIVQFISCMILPLCLSLINFPEFGMGCFFMFFLIETENHILPKFKDKFKI